MEYGLDARRAGSWGIADEVKVGLMPLQYRQSQLESVARLRAFQQPVGVIRLALDSESR